MVGARNEMLACASPTAAVTPVGAFGTVDGVAAAEGSDTPDVPNPFVAVTLNVYGAPFVKLLTTHVVAGAVEVQVPAILLLESKAVAV